MASSSRMIPALVDRLQQSGSEAEQQVVVQLLAKLSCSEGSEGVELSLAIEAACGVPVLLRCLEQSRSPELLHAAAVALEHIAVHSPGSSAAIVAPLVQHLGSAEQVVQVAALNALCRIVGSSIDSREAVVAAGGIPTLVRCLDSGSMRSSSVRSRGSSGSSGSDYSWTVAAKLLGCLANGSGDRRAAIAAAGAIPALLRVLRNSGSNERAQAAAAGALWALARGSPANSDGIAAGGAIPVLVRLLSSSGSSEDVQLVATGALGCLTQQHNSQISTWVAAAGGIAALVPCLQHGRSEAVQEPAAAAVANLAHRSPSRSAAIAAAGAIPMLVHCLQHSSSQLLNADAAAALNNLASASPGRCSAIHAAGGTAALQRLQLGSSSATIKQAAAIAVHAIMCSGSRMPGAGMGETAAAAAGSAVAVGKAAAAGSTAPAQAAAGIDVAAGLFVQHQPLGAPTAPAPRSCAADGCGNTRRLRRCQGGCGAVSYCSDACSRVHFPAHKAECRRLFAAAAVRPA